MLQLILSLICTALILKGASPDESLPKKYATAACIPLASIRTITPNTRQWDHTLTLHNGAKVVITGARIPGGKVYVSYPEERRDIVAADPADYVYPSDVRLDVTKELLYTKANGLAGGFSAQTWLFEYDLRQHRITKRLQVKNGTLPAACPETPPKP